MEEIKQFMECWEYCEYHGFCNLQDNEKYADTDISDSFIKLSSKYKLDDNSLFKYQLVALLTTCKSTTPLIQNTECFSICSGDTEDDKWQLCSDFAYHNLDGISVLDTFAKVLRHFETRDSELCQETAKELDALQNLWNLKFDIEPHNPKESKYIPITGYFWRPGSDRCLAKELKVRRPSSPDPFFTLLIITYKMICEITLICNELQEWYKNVAPEIFEGKYRLHGFRRKEIDDWITKSQLMHNFGIEKPGSSECKNDCYQTLDLDLNL